MKTECTALTVPCSAGYDLVSSQRTFWLGPHDPTMRIAAGEVWRTTRSPRGPATYRTRRSESGVEVWAWGPGASWVAEHAVPLLGLDDEPEAFVPQHPLLRRLAREHRGLHLPRTLRLYEQLVPVVLQQLVTWREAMAAYRRLVRRYGEPAPGPPGLSLAPAPDRLARISEAELVALGVLGRQARTLHRVARHIQAIERLEGGAPDRVRRGLQSLQGIGPWTSGWTSAVTLGDPDAVLLGDVHLPHDVCFALTGQHRGDDAQMLELLEPFEGQRWRAVTLLRRGGPRRPRRRPRRAGRRRAAR